MNAAAPGIIKSPLHAPQTHGASGAFNPLGGMGEMSEIADTFLFRDCAPFISAEALHGGDARGSNEPESHRDNH